MKPDVLTADEEVPSSGSWLCRDDVDRTRLLDMEDRLRPARAQTFAILALGLVATGPTLGWWPLLCIPPAAVGFAIADISMPRVTRPEHVMFLAWFMSELLVAGAVALSGGPRAATISWLAIPVLTLSARFSMRGVVAGVTITLLLVLAVAFGVDAQAVVSQPVRVIVPLALVLSVAILSTPLMRSEMQHRSAAAIDPLTGLLNRKALATRVAELTGQSEITGEPIGLIVADLDHFKDVNDTYGHAAGDAVLKDAAYLLRKHLRAFDLAYRLGGEEFLILLPGSDVQHAAELAERLREAISADDVGGLHVTLSLGVDASKRGEAFDYQIVFAKADAALYRAKQGGRDQVCVVDHETPPAFV